MKNTIENRKNIFYTTMLLLTLIITIIGTVYAFVMLMDSQEEDSSTIYTGTLQIDYETGRKIECRLMPIYTPASMDDPDAYLNTFNITSTGTLNSVVNISMVISNNEFSDDSLRYALYNTNKELLQTGKINGTDTIILGENILIKTQETATYTLQIWLEENNEEQNEEMSKTFLATIEVDGTQEKE